VDGYCELFLSLEGEDWAPSPVSHIKRLSKVTDCELVPGDAKFKPSASARNLGVYYYSLLSFKLSFKDC